jgi:predicted MFS family arabinose efflux permease
LTQYLDWRWVLFVNVPFVLVAATLAVIAVRDLRNSKRRRLDVVGAILATASTTLLAYGCIHAGEHAWDNAVTVSALAGAVLAGLAFVGWQQRAEAPLIRLSVLRTRAVWVATVIIAFIGTATVAGFYFASLSLQNVLRYDPVTTGLAFLPFCAGMAAATMASSSLVERYGHRKVLTVGLTVAAAGMLGSRACTSGPATPPSSLPPFRRRSVWEYASRPHWHWARPARCAARPAWLAACSTPAGRLAAASPWPH